MTADIETIGALGTASLAAHEIDGAAAAHDKHGEPHPTHCANCGTALEGAFCHDCGQRSHLHRSLLHLGEEVLHGVLHFDAKAWRTLPLLVAKPGALTRRYIDGQRTRFVSPLALFLFMIFFLFFMGSYFGKGNVNATTPGAGAAGRAELQADIAEARAKVAKAEAALKAAGPARADIAQAEDGLKEARGDLSSLEAFAATYDVANNAPGVSGGKPSDWSALKVTTDIRFIDEAVKHAKDNPDLALYKLKNAASKFSFLLVPISLPFLWLMFFWRRGVTMYDHAVFSLYSLCFMSLFFVALILLNFAGLSGAVVPLLFIVPPLHMFVQLRGAYGLTWAQALWRTVVLLTVAATVFFLYLVVILFLSM